MQFVFIETHKNMSLASKCSLDSGFDRYNQEIMYHPFLAKVYRQTNMYYHLLQNTRIKVLQH